MNRAIILLLPLALLIASCENKEPADKNPDKSSDKPAAKAKTVKVTKGLCRVEVSLHGVLAAGESTDVRFSPKTWTGPFTVRKVAPHGASVDKGDVLVELDTTKLDHAIRDLESEQRLSELAIRQAEAELPVLEKLMPIELAEAERLKKQAIENQDHFLAVEKPRIQENAKQDLKYSQYSLDYAREELKQLQKMYRDKDLTEETEEMILKRQRHYVEWAEFSLKWTKVAVAESLEVTLPRAEINVRESARKLTLAHEKAVASLPLGLTQKKLALAKLKHDYDKSSEQLVKLHQDRKLMTVVAPADGVVYYGKAVHGQFQADAHNPILQKLSVGGDLSPEEVFMTIVPSRPALVYATVEEKDLHQLKARQSCKVVPTGFPDSKLDAKIKSLDPVRQPTGSFLALVTVDSPDRELRPAMNCTVKVPVYEKAGALLIPSAAVQREEADDDQTYVNMVKGKGETVKRPVKIGKTMGTKTEVLNGLKEGDEILDAKPEED